jgi:hypothetical protein
MKQSIVKMLRLFLCAATIATCAAAAPSVTISILVDTTSSPPNVFWTGLKIGGQNGGTLGEGIRFSTDNKQVWRGTFSTVFPSDCSGSPALLIVDEDSLQVIGSIPVNNLSCSGTASTNIFILEIDPSTASMTFRSMNGGLPGTVSDIDVWEPNDKILAVGDFGSAGSLTYADFRIWDIGNVAWDTYTMILNAYDGYWPASIQKDSTDTWIVNLSTMGNAYGGYTDNDGWESFPWTTEWVKWDISLQRWIGYGE